MMERLPTLDDLSRALRQKRLSRTPPLTPGQAAQEADVGEATFRRAEQGTHAPNGDNAIKLFAWAGMLRDESQPEVADPLEHLGQVLFADPRLTQAQAEAVLNIVRAVYDVFLATNVR